jgi:peptidyl-prolyl cis-trans isomerase B (cyclophilin B)
MLSAKTRSLSLAALGAGLVVLGGLAPAQPVAAEGNPTVTIQTNKGEIQLELFAEQAPVTVENFLSYARSGFYDGTIFHRVISHFMIQGGGFTADMEKKPTGEPIANEAANGLSNKRGTIAMARTSDPHSATAQFFINVQDNMNLDHTGRPTRAPGATPSSAVSRAAWTWWTTSASCRPPRSARTVTCRSSRSLSSAS